MLKFRVDDDRCTRCGLCALDCPTRIIEQEGDALPRIPRDREAQCMQCQHCLAICPTAALSILGREPGRSLPLETDGLPDLDSMSRFVRGRRSVRHYRDENVDRALVNRMLATLANVPTGANRRGLTFSVIDDKDAMERLRAETMRALAEAAEAGRIPGHFAYLHTALPAYFERGVDIIFRGAPHALIVSAPPDAPCPNEDVTLALAYFDLLAQSARLGTVWWGMLKMVLETLPAMKERLGLPEGHAYYGMLFGLPGVHYSRTVQRDDAAKIRQITI